MIPEGWQPPQGSAFHWPSLANKTQEGSFPSMDQRHPPHRACPGAARCLCSWISCKWGLLGLEIKGQLIPHPWMQPSSQHYCPISHGKQPSNQECQGCCVSPDDLRSALGTPALWPLVLKRGMTCTLPHPHQPRALASPQSGQLQPDNFNGQDPATLRSYQVLTLDIIWVELNWPWKWNYSKEVKRKRSMESRHYLLIKSGVGRQEHGMLRAAGTA